MQSRLLSPVSNFVDAVRDLGAAVRSALELAAAAAVHLAGVVVRARAREEGRVVVYALLPASQACMLALVGCKATAISSRSLADLFLAQMRTPIGSSQGVGVWFVFTKVVRCSDNPPFIIRRRRRRIVTYDEFHDPLTFVSFARK